MASVKTAQQKPTVVDIPDEREMAVRKQVMKKVTVQKPLRVDIRNVGANRWRVNVWQQFDGNNDFVKDQRIVESFYHVGA